jgi:cytochrome c oxidase subunit 2
LAARPGRYLVALAGALLAVLALAGPAQAVSVSPQTPHSPNAEDIDTSYWVMLVLTVALLLVVQAALIGAVIRFRAERGRGPSRFAAGRGALRPALAGLSLIAIAVLVFGIVMTSNVREIEPTGPNGLHASAAAQVGLKGVPPLTALEGEESAAGEAVPGEEPAETTPLQINAIAQQWLWRFEYPGHDPSTNPLFSYGELVVPVDTAVILNIDSTDVLHSWWVPSLGGQVQATPGDIAQTWFKADEEGVYPGRSTIFDGTAYPAMRAWVNVVSVPEYQSYVDRLRDDLAAAQTAAQAAAAEPEQ